MHLSLAEQAAIDRWRPGNTRVNRALAWLVISLSQHIMCRRNRLAVDGLERLKTLQERGDRGLLTFSNHVSRLDDPLLVSNFGLAELPYDRMRWVAADAIKLFSSRFSAYVFSAGKCVPTVRGGGLDQPALRFLSQRLGQGDWIHIFPEGGASRDPEARLRHPFKAGIGRLIDEARPLALPFYHHGMQHVAPLRQLPSRGHQVTVRFGEAVDCNDAFVTAVGGERDADRLAMWNKISEWAYRALKDLEHELPHPSSPQRGAR